ncbi:hypothetical protein [Clostridium grantii]|uniref:Uncharacterized protein n=1 Tax=Clostridium grantii DSM 8605 TaxID=1121316 RepID=A0A1M5WYZ3_9CLOT|nr:hypothetical protein [Clostridium grantii]SHH92905.1 hypothetical protein SAMN02745207_03219 [Clostridium grantii DSM 8605]SHI07280.1 hypothetical protein SAMN02745207_04211 [Clostridium grantii DSM 8605]
MKKIASVSSLVLLVGILGYYSLRRTPYDFIFIIIIVIGLVLSYLNNKKNRYMDKNNSK